ncbi:unnamed protein product, partial [Cyprideis torosa]
MRPEGAKGQLISCDIDQQRQQAHSGSHGNSRRYHFSERRSIPLETQASLRCSICIRSCHICHSQLGHVLTLTRLRLNRKKFNGDRLTQFSCLAKALLEAFYSFCVCLSVEVKMKRANQALRDKRLARFLERQASSVGVETYGKTISNFEDALFNVLKSDSTKAVNMFRFIKELENEGIIFHTDPRLKEMRQFLQHLAESTSDDGLLIDNLHLDKEKFIDLFMYNPTLISRAFRRHLIIPEFETFKKIIKGCFEKCRHIKEGQPSNFIQELASIDPNIFAVSICTIDGQRFSLGDTKKMFTLQAISQVFIYALAHTMLDSTTVHTYVGQEPSGRTAGELVLDYNKKPHNPLIDAGGIVVCAILQKLVHPEMKYSEKFDWLLARLETLAAGTKIEFNNGVFIASKYASDRNMAQAFHMNENKVYPSGTDLRACFELYLQCKAMEMTTDTLAIMAATLANGGICPLTDEVIFSNPAVGMPAKTGCSGGMLVVVPNVMGVAIYSPPVDAVANSVRAVSFCKELIRLFNFHHYDSLKMSSEKRDPRQDSISLKAENVVGLLFSAASGDVTAMRRYHMSGMNMSICDYDKRTALHLASAEGQYECVEFLLKTC